MSVHRVFYLTCDCCGEHFPDLYIGGTKKYIEIGYLSIEGLLFYARVSGEWLIEDDDPNKFHLCPKCARTKEKLDKLNRKK